MQDDRLKEFFKRLRYAAALLIGYGGGKALEAAAGNNGYFAIGFMVTAGLALLGFRFFGDESKSKR